MPSQVSSQRPVRPSRIAFRTHRCASFAPRAQAAHLAHETRAEGEGRRDQWSSEVRRRSSVGPRHRTHFGSPRVVARPREGLPVRPPSRPRDAGSSLLRHDRPRQEQDGSHIKPMSISSTTRRISPPPPAGAATPCRNQQMSWPASSRSRRARQRAAGGLQPAALRWRPPTPIDDDGTASFRSMKLLADEHTFTRGSGGHPVQLQRFLDHVEDTILTVDDCRSHPGSATTAPAGAHVRLPGARVQRLDLLIPSLAVTRPRRDARRTRRVTIEKPGGSTLRARARVAHGRRTLFDAELRHGGRARSATTSSSSACATSRSACRTSRHCARARRVIERSSRTRPRRSSCSTSIAASSSTRTKTPSSYSSCRARSCSCEGPKLCARTFQSDGLPSAGLHRSYVERTLRGARPVFEWPHRDGQGNDVPCEVRPRFDLPSSKHRLIRASIHDNGARRKPDTARVRRASRARSGSPPMRRSRRRCWPSERPSSTPLRPGVVGLLDTDANTLNLVAGCGCRPLSATSAQLPVGPRDGSCGVADRPAGKSSSRDIASDPLWDHLATGASRRRARLLVHPDPYRRRSRASARSRCISTRRAGPLKHDFELMARLHRSSPASRSTASTTRKRSGAARRATVACSRTSSTASTGPTPTGASNRPILHWSTCSGFASAEELLALPSTSALFVDPAERERVVAALHEDGMVRSAEYQLRRRDGPIITVVENAACCAPSMAPSSVTKARWPTSASARQSRCSSPRRRRRRSGDAAVDR